MDEVVEEREDRIADRKDPFAIVGEIDAMISAGFLHGGPERLARSVQPSEDLLGQGPGGSPRRIERLQAPSVDSHLHISAGCPFSGHGTGGTERFEVGIL